MTTTEQTAEQQLADLRDRLEALLEYWERTAGNWPTKPAAYVRDCARELRAALSPPDGAPTAPQGSAEGGDTGKPETRVRIDSRDEPTS